MANQSNAIIEEEDELSNASDEDGLVKTSAKNSNQQNTDTASVTGSISNVDVAKPKRHETSPFPKIPGQVGSKRDLMSDATPKNIVRASTLGRSASKFGGF